MIDLDSPVETVLGEPKDKRSRSRNQRIVEGLGIETVGDLLRHFPRRYVETGQLTALEDLEKGQLLTVVGEIAQSRINTYKDRRTHRPAYRVDVTVRTEGHSLRMSFFAKHQGMADWHANRMPVGRRGIFLGQADTFRGEWQLTHPQMVLFGGPDEDTAQLCLESIGAFYPIYPLTKGVESWDLQRAISFARTMVETVPELLPADVRQRTTCSTPGRRSTGSTPPTAGARSSAPSTATGSRRRWSPSWCWAAGAGRSARWAPGPATAATAGCWRRSTRGCRSS